MILLSSLERSGYHAICCFDQELRCLFCYGCCLKCPSFLCFYTRASFLRNIYYLLFSSNKNYEVENWHTKRTLKQKDGSVLVPPSLLFLCSCIYLQKKKKENFWITAKTILLKLALARPVPWWKRDNIFHFWTLARFYYLPEAPLESPAAPESCDLETSPRLLCDLCSAHQVVPYIKHLRVFFSFVFKGSRNDRSQNLFKLGYIFADLYLLI